MPPDRRSPHVQPKAPSLSNEARAKQLLMMRDGIDFLLKNCGTGAGGFKRGNHCHKLRRSMAQQRSERRKRRGKQRNQMKRRAKKGPHTERHASHMERRSSERQAMAQRIRQERSQLRQMQAEEHARAPKGKGYIRSLEKLRRRHIAERKDQAKQHAIDISGLHMSHHYSELRHAHKARAENATARANRTPRPAPRPKPEKPAAKPPAKKPEVAKPQVEKPKPKPQEKPKPEPVKPQATKPKPAEKPAEQPKPAPAKPAPKPEPQKPAAQPKPQPKPVEQPKPAPTKPAEQPKPTPKPETEQPKPQQPKPVTPPAPAKPAPRPATTPKPTHEPSRRPSHAQPIHADRPIRDRLQAYEAGDRKVAAIRDLHESNRHLIHQRNALSKQEHDLLDQIEPMERGLIDFHRKNPNLRGQDKADLDLLGNHVEQLRTRMHEIRSQKEKIDDSIRAKVLEHIKVENPVRFSVNDVKRVGELEMASVDPVSRASVNKAREWLESVTARGEQAEVKVGITQWRKEDFMRDSFMPEHTAIALSPETTSKSVVHEFGHAIETLHKTGSNRVLDRSQEFLAHRVGDERPQRMADLFPKHGYKDKELGRKDRFDEAFGDGPSAYYIGKDYGAHGTEILSMGVEKLYSDPIGFARKDPEYCKYVLGILDGSLR